VVKAPSLMRPKGKEMTDLFQTSGTSPTDFVCENHGSVFLLRPTSPAAADWIEAHLPEDRLTFNGAVVVEPRYVWKILVGLQDDGLVAVPR